MLPGSFLAGQTYTLTLYVADGDAEGRGMLLVQSNLPPEGVSQVGVARDCYGTAAGLLWDCHVIAA